MIKKIWLFRHFRFVFGFISFNFLIMGCGQKKQSTDTAVEEVEKSTKLKVIFDTDCNNELDDQHALAYLLSNGQTFDLEGVTVNATRLGGDIQEHYKEASRILQLYNLQNSIPLIRGANKGFAEVLDSNSSTLYDGKEAVEFILNKTRKDSIVIIAVGKLTNIALALKKDPTLATRTKIVWLGSNYPEPGEYNQNNDTIAMNCVLNSTIPFEMVTVRYGKSSGTDAVKISQKEVNQKMPGLGPLAKTKIVGRHGGTFTNFGDYSVSLFEHIEYHSDPPTRSMFDMVAVAILKNQGWGEPKTIPAPVLINNKWVNRPENRRKITIWENFDKTAILEDFYTSLQSL